MKNRLVGTIIKTFPDPILQKVSEPWDFERDKINVSELHYAMICNDGCGIAAPQIGISKRVIIACDILMFNPTYTVPMGTNLVKDWEGCLSLPGQTCLVKRYQTILVEYYDVNGNKHQIYANDFQARVIQHEIDHIDGVLMFDRVYPHGRLRGYGESNTI